MAKYLVELKEGTDKDAFCDQAIAEGYTCTSRLQGHPSGTFCSFSILDSALEAFASKPEVKGVAKEKALKHCAYNGTPITRTGQYRATNNNAGFPASFDGRNYMPYHWYQDTYDPNNANIGRDGRKVGFFDSTTTDGSKVEDSNGTESNMSISAQTIAQKYDGSLVDIVIFDLDDPGGPTRAAVEAHPDFKDSQGNYRIIYEDWNDYNPSIADTLNLQVTNPPTAFQKHQLACISAAAGKYCGWASGADVRYIVLDADSVEDVYQAVYNWHAAKSPDPATGIRRPTICSNSWGYIWEYQPEYLVPIDKINTITYYDDDGNETVETRPGGGWSNDRSAWLDAGFMLYLIQGETVAKNKWCVAVQQDTPDPEPTSTWSSFWAGLNDSVDGQDIFWFFSGGNDLQCMAREDQPQYNNKIDVDSGQVWKDLLDIQYSYMTETTFSTPQDLWTHRGSSAGIAKNFYIGAAAASADYPTLEEYTARGPFIDVYAGGRKNWTAGADYDGVTDISGHIWGYFSGTSNACPIAAGASAIWMETFWYKNRRWPTKDELRTWLRTNGADHPLPIEDDFGQTKDGTPQIKTALSDPADGGLWSTKLQNCPPGALPSDTYTGDAEHNSFRTDSPVYSRDYTLSVTNNGSSSWLVTGESERKIHSSEPYAIIYCTEDDNLTFNVNASGHPFYFYDKFVLSGGTAYANNIGGISGQGVEIGTATLDVAAYRAAYPAKYELYYQCSLHVSMWGIIRIRTHTSTRDANYSGYVLDGAGKRLWMPWSLRMAEPFGSPGLEIKTTYGSRPSTGQTYPRRKIRIG